VDSKVTSVVRRVLVRGVVGCGLSLYVVQRYVGAFGSEVREGVSCFVAESVPRSLVVYDWDGLFIEYSSSRGVERVATVSSMGFRWF